MFLFGFLMWSLKTLDVRSIVDSVNLEWNWIYFGVESFFFETVFERERKDRKKSIIKLYIIFKKSIKNNEDFNSTVFNRFLNFYEENCFLSFFAE